MAVTIPDLWGDQIRVDILTPLAILRAQADLIGKHTKGILKAEIHTSFGDSRVEHDFELVAPLANYYRERLLTAAHEVKLVYPVLLTAEAFALRDSEYPPLTFLPSDLEANQREAPTDSAFMKLVGEVFRSTTVQSLIQSLIAVSNEVRPPEGAEMASSDEPDAH